MMKIKWTTLVLAPAFALAAAACSSDDKTPPTTPDAGGGTPVTDAAGTVSPEAGSSTGPKTVAVTVAEGGLSFSPSAVTVNVGDTVTWTWAGSGHSVVSGSDCTADNEFCDPSDSDCGNAPTLSKGGVYSHTFTTAGSYPYFCAPHCSLGMTGTVTVQ